MSDTDSDSEDGTKITLSDRVKDLLPELVDNQLGYSHFISRKTAKKLVNKRSFPQDFNLKVPSATKSIEGIDSRIKDEKMRFEKDLHKLHLRMSDTLLVLLDTLQMMDDRMEVQEDEDEEEEEEGKEEREATLIIKEGQVVFNRLTEAVKLMNYVTATINVIRTNNIESALGVTPKPLILDEKIPLISKDRINEIYAAKKKEQKINDILKADRKKKVINKRWQATDQQQPQQQQQQQQQQQYNNNQKANGFRGNEPYRGRGNRGRGRGRGQPEAINLQ
ncbi:hypothetical protein ACTFIZ_011471 [Dictyostelium cf. discoideum]